MTKRRLAKMQEQVDDRLAAFKLKADTREVAEALAV